MKKEITQKIEKIMESKTGTDAFFSFENFLLGCSKIYSVGIKVRSLLYKFSVIRSKKLPCFVISIGNITVGGTGKTPMTMYVAKIIKDLGYKPVVITRGYQGKYKGAQSIVSDGSNFFLSVHDAGDEAFMMAEVLKIPVIVGKKRFQAGKLAIKEFNPDVIILDDAFQHIALKRDLDLLLCDFNKPLGNFQLLPRGRLREPHTALERSDAVIFTRSDKTEELDQKKPVQTKKLEIFKNKQVFNTCHSAFVADALNCPPSFDLTNLNIKVFLFSGIANNGDFRSTCEKMGMEINGVAEFPDHHWYAKGDLISIYEKFKESRADYLITTQKDYIKIKEPVSDFFPSICLLVIGVKIKFKPEDKDKFANLIKSEFSTYLKTKE